MLCVKEDAKPIRCDCESHLFHLLTAAYDLGSTGEKAQLSGSAMGAKEYEKSESGKGSDATTPAGGPPECCKTVVIQPDFVNVDRFCGKTALLISAAAGHQSMTSPVARHFATSSDFDALAGESSGGGVANDKSESAKGTH